MAGPSGIGIIESSLSLLNDSKTEFAVRTDKRPHQPEEVDKMVDVTAVSEDEETMPQNIDNKHVEDQSDIAPVNEKPIKLETDEVLEDDDTSDEEEIYFPLSVDNRHLEEKTDPLATNTGLSFNERAAKYLNEMTRIHQPFFSNTSIKREETEETNDSDSDVEFIGKKDDEIIELSDDETKEFNELMSTLSIPNEVIDNLRKASYAISQKIGDCIKHKMTLRDTVTEITNKSWTLPWMVVSNIFKNPDWDLSSIPVSKRVFTSKIKKEHVKRVNCYKSRKLSSLKSNTTEENNKKVIANSIKTESDDLKDVPLTVVHFNSNKPPEFKEYTRSGRRLKQPTRLSDSLTPTLFYKNKAPLRKRPIVRNDTEDDNSLSSRNVGEICSDNIMLIKEQGFENYGVVKHLNKSSRDPSGDDFEKMDDNLTVLSVDGEQSLYDSSGDISVSSPASNIDTALSSTVFSPFYPVNDCKKRYHILSERERRLEMKKLFDNLQQEIGYADQPVSKIRILTDSLSFIRKYEYELKYLRDNHRHLLSYNRMLKKKHVTGKFQLSLQRMV